jgi:hypothetical protein
MLSDGAKTEAAIGPSCFCLNGMRGRRTRGLRLPVMPSDLVAGLARAHRRGPNIDGLYLHDCAGSLSPDLGWQGLEPSQATSRYLVGEA